MLIQFDCFGVLFSNHESSPMFGWVLGTSKAARPFVEQGLCSAQIMGGALHQPTLIVH